MIGITGISGFVGKNLYTYLTQLSIVSKAISRDELNENLNIQNLDSVIHLAGKAHDLKKTANPEEYYLVNLELTKKLFNEFLKSDAKKFIFISSVKATADHLDSPLTEEHPSNPLTHYGKSKLLAEEYIINQPLPKGKSYYILRPCMIHGPGNKGNLNLLYKFVSKGIPYPLAAFNNKRSFLSVENLCFIIKELLERNDIPSGVYNVADDEALSTTQLFSLLSQSLNKSPFLLNISPRIISFIAKLGDKLRLPLNTERLGKLTENYVVSNAKIKKALKKDLPLSTREGILLTARSFKDQIA